MLSPDFGSLFRFLDVLDNQVTGRHADRPSPEIEARLLRLLNGETPCGDERAALFQALRDNPTWTAWLAGQVKARRAKASDDEA
jgi:hypothetical protein